MYRSIRHLRLRFRAMREAIRAALHGDDVTAGDALRYGFGA